MKLLSIFVSFFILFCTVETKSNLTLDTYFNYTSFHSLSLSPNGKHVLFETQRPMWDLNTFENSLWLYQTVERRKKLITNQLYEGVMVQWSPSGKWFAFLVKNNSVSNTFSFGRQSKVESNAEQNIYLYSIESDQIKSISIGNDILLALTWGQDDSSLYYAAINFNSSNDKEWKDVIQYRSNPTCIIRQINISSGNEMSLLRRDIVDVPFLIGELLYIPIQEKLIVSSISLVTENTDILQIYSIDLKNVSSIIQLTTGQSFKGNLQLTRDNKRVFFQTAPIGSIDGSSTLTQLRLYSIDLSNGLIERWASDFQGSVQTYTTNSDGGVYILGQWGINVHVYSQTSPKNILILHDGFNGAYLLISSSSLINSTAFIFSSFSKAQEVYFITDINQLKSAVVITNENNQYDQIDLPQAQSYQWTNNEDNQTIEGILHYPPGKFQEKNLPLLVLMHGGPTGASLNSFTADWYTWAPMAATEGWLVFEPNYRGSTGYGDQFTNAIRYQPLTRPEKDILLGVDHLIQEGIADRTKLAIGGYSYGGILTNWLITQTTRFNAALSGAGSIEQVSFWGMTDVPAYIADLSGGLPWKVPKIYQNQSAIYYFDQIRTPTHIVAGENDVRVPVSQSLMLERGLRYLGIPVKLLLLPNEGHPLSNNPWHGKIKVREEIQWLQLYGYNSTIIDKN